APPPDTKGFGYVHDHLLCYRKSEQFQRNYLPMTEDQTGRYKNPDNDPRGPWKSENYTCRYTADERPNLYYPIINPHTGEEIWPSKTRVWAMSRGVTE
ncbi:site-specific DNA-methyltransferase, partial [Klebsiella pneumoniae]|nr:site-specific DNA-methyltransferase [Klebsiella pneumoniae]